MLETMKKSTRRKLAFLLAAVLTLQSVFTGTGAGAMTAKAEETEKAADIGTNTAIPLGTGNPADAFINLTAKVLQEIKDGTTVQIRFDADLNDGYLGDIQSDMLSGVADGGEFLNPMEFDERGNDPLTGRPAKAPEGPYASYEDYLNAQENLPQVSYTCTLSGETFDINQAKSAEIHIGTDGNGEKIGSYKIEGDGENLVLTVVFDKMIFNRYDVSAGFTADFELNKTYEQGATAGGTAGDGGIDINVGIKGEEDPNASNSGYVIEKKGEKEGSTGIKWEIHAYASPSDAAKPVPSDNPLENGENLTPEEPWTATPSAASVNVTEATPSTPSNPSNPSNPGNPGEGAEDPDIATDSIVRAAEEINLAGKVIYDAIPEGLILEKVTAVINGADAPVELKEGDDYTYKDGKFSYTVSGTDGEKVTDVKLELHTGLSPKLVNDAALANSDSVTYEFSNRAQLKNGADGPDLAASKWDNQDITVEKFLDKIGEPRGLNPGMIDWTLTVEPHFGAGVQLYLVDHIEDITHAHKYDPNEPVKLLQEITENNFEQKEEFTIRLLNTLDTPYPEPSYDDLINITKMGQNPLNLTAGDFQDPENSTKKQVLIYNYDTGKTNNAGEKIIDAVMLIPLSDYLDGKLKIKYSTDTKIPGVYEKTEDLKNEVKAIWKWPDGETPGEEFGGLTVHKDTPFNSRLVTKEGTGYDAATNLLTWEFGINQFKVAMKNLVITDEFDLGEQSWAGAREPLALTKTGTVGTREEIPYSEAKPAEGVDGYTVTTGVDNTKQVLTIYLGSIAEDEAYTLEIKTRLSNEILESMTSKDAEDGSVNIPNTAAVDAVINGGHVYQDTNDVSNEVENPLIDKKAIPFEGGEYYNFDSNKVKWSVEINQNHWTLKPSSTTNTIEITDKLPLGTTFGEMTCVKKGGPDGTPLWSSSDGGTTATDGAQTITWNTIQSDNELGYPEAHLTITFDHASTDDDYYFEFTTSVDDSYREKEFKSHGSAELKNTATLTAALEESGDFTISDTAVNTIKPYPVSKNGEYFKDKTLTFQDNGEVEKMKGFHWQVIVNRTNVEMAGAVIEDQIQECMELLPNTLKVQKLGAGELDEKGELLAAEKPLDELDPNYQFQSAVPSSTAVSEADENHFRYTIPVDFKKTERLLISFDTVLVSDASVSDMTNAIKVNNGGTEDHTDDIQGTGAEDFHVADYAGAKGMYFFEITKTTSTDHGTHSFPLQGAKFEVTEGDSNPDGYGPDFNPAPKSKTKNKTTGKTGKASLIFLKPGIWYKIQETQAPAGYALPVSGEDTWYLWIDEGGNYSEVDASSQAYHIPNGYSLPIDNTPATSAANKVSFTKMGWDAVNGQPSPLEGASFKITHKVLSVDQEVTTDASGIVTFDGLDVSTVPYTITETITPNGYEKLSPIFAYVESDAGGVNVRLKLNNKELTANAATGLYEVTNEPVRKSGSFTKVDQNGTPIAISGITFNVERKNDGLFGTPKDNAYASYTENPTVSTDAEGVVEISDFLVGEYQLTEAAPPAGLSLAETPDPVYLRVTDTGIEIQQGTYKENRYETLTGDSTVTNIRQYGFVQVNKAIGEKTAGGAGLEGNASETDPIEGAIFAIYEQNNAGTAAGSPIMYLKTDDTGKFQYDVDGNYTTCTSSGASAASQTLLVGTYVLKETTPAPGFEANDTEYPFEIEVWDSTATTPSDTATVVYINSNDVMNPVSGTVGDDTAAAATKFYNEPIRGKVALEKVDRDKTDRPVTGARFEVFDKTRTNVKVAELKEVTANSGQYSLSPLVAGGTTKDRKGRLYLQQDTAGDYELLQGSYTLEEKTVPGNYQEPTDITLTIDKDGNAVITGKDTITVDGVIKITKITNTLGVQDISVQKYTEKRVNDPANPNQTKHDSFERAEEGFKFNLSGTSQNTKHYNRTIETGSTGIAEFSDVPIGDYVLKETDIPDSYKTDSTRTEWLKSLTMPITVKVTEDPITKEVSVGFSYTDDSGTLVVIHDDTEFGYADINVTAETDLIYTTSNGDPNAVLNIANLSKRGSADGTKVMDFGDGNTLNFPGVEFNLYGLDGTTLYAAATTDPSGKFTFQDIPYGKYILKETSQTGYVTPKDISVTIDATKVTMCTKGNKNEQITNTPIRKSASVKKVDQNGDSITDPVTGNIQPIQFKVDRRQDGLFGDTVNDQKFAPYTVPGQTVQQTVTTDDTGTLEFENFFVGEYRLTEQPLVGVNLAVAVEPFYLKVTESGIEIGSVTDGKMDDSETITDWKSIETDGSTTIVNKLQYGFVQINKVIGERKTDGTGLERITGAALPEGVVFNIYKTGETTPFMQIKTDKNGKFLCDQTAGTYTNYLDNATGEPKTLLCGSYTLKEESIPAPYDKYLVPDQTEYPFTVTWNKGPQEVYVDSETRTTSSEENTLFLNEAKRNTVSLEKVDADTKVFLHGAEFGIYTNNQTPGITDVMVARLEEKGTFGKYELAYPRTPGDGAWGRTNPQGIDYLYNSDGSGTYKLLYGDYILRELTSPTDYDAPVADNGISLTIGDTVEITGDGVMVVGGTQKLTNKIKTVRIPIHKFIEEREPDKSNSSSTTRTKEEIKKAEAGFQFRLSGYPKNAPAELKTWTGITDAIGDIVFANIPLGTYTLEETAVPASYQISGIETVNRMEKLMVTVENINNNIEVTFYHINPDGTRGGSIATGGESGLKGLPYNLVTSDRENLYVVNSLKLGSISATKKAKILNGLGTEQSVPVEGIEFKLTGSGSAADEFTATTGIGGALSFTNLPYGTYTLTEVSKDGYKALSPMTVTIDSEIANAINAGGVINNEPVRGGGSFQKVDQNGETIPTPITFHVFRRNDGLFGSSSTETGWDQCVTYGEHSVLVTDAGVLKFEDFLYGEYMLTEPKNLNSSMNWAKDPQPIYLKITGTDVEIGHKLNAITSEVDDYKPLSTDPAAPTQVSNQLQYGFVEVNKAVGEKNPFGDLEAYTGEPSVLAGAEFTIYKADDTGHTNPLMTLTTDRNGKFTHDANGLYTDKNGNKRALLIGRYVLVESALTGFKDNTTAYAFEIEPWTADATGQPVKTTLYIDSNNAGTPSTDTNTKFYNEPKRNTVTLAKQDSTTATAVSGAEFSVYLPAASGSGHGDLVAKLAESPVPGRYVLDKPGSKYTEKNGDGLYYLYSVDGKAPYSLLYGDYVLEETTVPPDYTDPNAGQVISLTVGDKVAMKVGTAGASTEEILLKNAIKSVSIPVQKFVEKREPDGSGTKFTAVTAAEADFEFKLEGKPLNGNALSRTETTNIVSGISTAIFRDVPAGDYTLTETALPGGAYRVDGEETLNKMSAAVKVKVRGSAAGITVEFRDEADNLIATGGSDGLNGTTLVNSGQENGLKTLHVLDTLKLGSASGTKVAVTDIGDKPAQGITFDLYKDYAADGTNTLKLTATTDENGLLSFTDLPFGIYTLKEKSKDGYEGAADIEFTVKTVAPVTAITSPGKTNIVNTPVRGGGSFQKVDQNGETIPTVKFAVERKNDGLFGTSTQDHDYVSYGERPELTTAGGTLTFSDFLYGEYRLTETEANNPDLHWAETPKPVYLKITGSALTDVEIGDAIVGGAINYKPLSTDPAAPTQVMNQLQYGFVEVNKRIGEQDGKGNLTGITAEPKKLENVEFDIYRQGADGKLTGSPIMTLTTDGNGKFTHDDKGVYITDGRSRALLTGKYVLKEKKTFDYMTANTAEYPFEIEPWTADAIGQPVKTTLYIDSNNAGAPKTDSATGFYNEPKRGSVTLTKLDESNVPVSGAEFSVYVKNKASAQDGALVAILRETDAKNAKGKYQLTPVKPGEGAYQSTNPDGLSWLYGIGDKEPYTILKGTYNLRETKVPDNYEDTNAGKEIVLTVDETAAVLTVDNTPAAPALTLINVVKKTSIPIGKYVETRKPDTKTGSEHDGFITGAAGNDFEFTILGTPVNAAKDSFTDTVITGAAGADGTAEFIDVPIGTYTITETRIPASYQMTAGTAVTETLNRMEPVIVKVEGTSGTGELKVTFSDEKGAELPGKGENGFVYDADNSQNMKLSTATDNGRKGAKLFIADTRKLGNIVGTKVALNKTAAGGDVRTLLEGVTFNLYEKGSDTLYASATTTQGGNLKFTDLPYGEYVLKEVVPAGYIPTEAEISVTLDKASETALTTSDPDAQITNELIRKTLRFSKTDQNGDLIKAARLEAEFKVEKANTDALADGIYWDTNTTFKNDADGVVELPDLGYGTYKVTETAPTAKDLLAEARKPFYVIVERGAQADTTKITLSDTEDPKDKDSHAKSVEKPDSNTDTYDFTKNSADEFTVENRLKYGKLTFVKAAADQDQNGDLVMSQNAPPLEGVIFSVYRDMDTADGDYNQTKDGPAVLTLVTGKDGRPAVDKEERYVDEGGKAQDYRLVYGNAYFIKETGFTADAVKNGLAERYRLDAGYYPFAVTREYAGKPVYFGTGATKVSTRANGSIAPGNISFTADPAGSSWRFPNSQLFRGTVIIEKLDEENAAPVKGAKLELFTAAGDKVAAFDDKGTGNYRLAQGTEQEGFTLLNDAGQSYLVMGSDGEYRLLAGSYYVQEITAPSGYILPQGEDGKWYFTITETQNKVTSNPAAADETGLTDHAGSPKKLTNRLAVQNVTGLKQVEEFTKGTYRNITAGEEFTFTLSGTKSNGDAYTATQKADPATSKVEFANVPGGKYTLKEEFTDAQKAVYQTPADVVVTVEEAGVTYEKDGTAAAGVTIRNDLKRGAVKARKLTHDKDGKELPLKEAGFKLTRLSENGDATADVRTAVSGEDGWFEFDKLPLGFYRLDETGAPSDYTESAKVWLIELKDENVTVEKGKELTELQPGTRPDGIKGTEKELRVFNDAVGSITVEKRAEFLKADGMTGEMKPGEGFRFKITGKSWDGKTVGTLADVAQITGTDVTVDQDAVLVTTGVDGMIRIDGLPAGNYTVTEEVNDRNDGQGAYVIDKAEKTADITVKDYEVEAAKVLCSNPLKRSAIQGLKTTSDGKTPLKNAVIGLFVDGTTEFKEENLYAKQTAVSGDDGVFRFENIPTGTYRVAELKAPSGYRRNAFKYYTVTVLDDGTVITDGTNETGVQENILITNNRQPPSGGGENPPTKPAGPTDPGPGGPGVPSEPGNPSESGPTEGTTGNVPPTEIVPHVPGTPDAGDHSIPAALLASIMLGAMGGLGVLLKKRKDLTDQDEA